MTEAEPYKTWQCATCGFIYDEAEGLPGEGFQQIPLFKCRLAVILPFQAEDADALAMGLHGNVNGAGEGQVIGMPPGGFAETKGPGGDALFLLGNGQRAGGMRLGRQGAGGVPQ